MQTLQTLQTANRKFDTGDGPVLILCDDRQEYVCKHALNGNAVNLICEYISASFLKLWELPVPDFCFINVNYEHVKDVGIQKRNFERTCFGSKFSKYFVELTMFNDEPDLKKINASLGRKLNLLKIALFDLWMSNEDRGINNLNLLLDVKNGYNIIPIDHGAVLNSRSLEQHIALLTENECLTSTDLMRHLYTKCDFSREDIRELKDYFYLCTLKCKQNFDEILKFIPSDWCSDLKMVTDKIENEVFADSWQDNVFNSFLEYINSPFK